MEAIERAIVFLHGCSGADLVGADKKGGVGSEVVATAEVPRRLIRFDKEEAQVHVCGWCVRVGWMDDKRDGRCLKGCASKLWIPFGCGRGESSADGVGELHGCFFDMSSVCQHTWSTEPTVGVGNFLKAEFCFAVLGA